MGSQNTRIKYLLMRKLWDHKILGFIILLQYLLVRKLWDHKILGLNICLWKSYGTTIHCFFKGTVQRDFWTQVFFHNSNLHIWATKSLTNRLKYFLPWVWDPGDSISLWYDTPANKSPQGIYTCNTPASQSPRSIIHQRVYKNKKNLPNHDFPGSHVLAAKS